MDPARIMKDAQKLIQRLEEELDTLKGLASYAVALNNELLRRQQAETAPAPAPVPASDPAPET
jgi:hypothetical protein